MYKDTESSSVSTGWGDSSLLATALAQVSKHADDHSSASSAAVPGQSEDVVSLGSPLSDHDASEEDRQSDNRAVGQFGRGQKLLVRRASGTEDADSILPRKTPSEWWSRHIMNSLADRRELLRPSRGFRLASFCAGSFAEGHCCKALLGKGVLIYVGYCTLVNGGCDSVQPHARRSKIDSFRHVRI
jgi:hypothetical protein